MVGVKRLGRWTAGVIGSFSRRQAKAEQVIVCLDSYASGQGQRQYRTRIKALGILEPDCGPKAGALEEPERFGVRKEPEVTR
jgi:hypothetical protein